MSLSPQQLEDTRNELHENFVKAGVPLAYYKRENSTLEMDFFARSADCLVPIEVKAERNLQAKSLKSYIDRFAPRKSLRISLSEHGNGKAIDEIPLYAVGSIVDDYLGGASIEE